MIILKPKETNILEGTLWLAQLQIPRFPFKSTKVMGTTCIGMDRQCNLKGQIENWSWGMWHYHPESPVKSTYLQDDHFGWPCFKFRPGFLDLFYTCQKNPFDLESEEVNDQSGSCFLMQDIVATRVPRVYLGDRIQRDLLGLGHSASLRQLMLRQWMGEDVK